MNTSDIPEEMTGKLEDTAMQTIQNKAQKEKKVLKKQYNRSSIPWWVLACSPIYTQLREKKQKYFKNNANFFQIYIEYKSTEKKIQQIPSRINVRKPFQGNPDHVAEH